MLIRNISFLVDITVFYLPCEGKTEVDFRVIICMHWFDSGSLCVWTMKICGISVCVMGLLGHSVTVASLIMVVPVTGVSAVKNQTFLTLFLFYLDYGFSWYCSWRISITSKCKQNPKFAIQKRNQAMELCLQSYFIRLGFSPPPGHVHLQDEEG